MPQGKLVDCTSAMTGEVVKIPIEEIKTRPSVYAIIWRDDRLLMVRSALTGRFFFPGGGIDPGEEPEDALRREIWEEAGLLTAHFDFWDSFENYVYANFEDTPWHETHPEFVNVAWRVEGALYRCEIVGRPDALISNDPEEGQPEWVDVYSLDPSELQDIAKKIVPLLIADR